MKFSDFMQDWLYSHNGYYTKAQIGKNGDFYTSVSSSIFFGGSIANRLIKNIENGFLSKNTNIVEIGADKGYLLADIIQFIYTLKPSLLESLSFCIIEPLDNLKALQKEYFKQSFGNTITLKHYKSLEECKLDEAFIVANELFDSFACEVIKDDKMLFIDDFNLYFDDINDEVKEIAKAYNIQKGEIPIKYPKFIESLCESFNHFEAIFFDYGELKPRNDISLRIYHKHNTYPFFSLTKFAKDKNIPFSLQELYQKSDITYDVCFEILMNEIKKNNVTLESFSTQMKALVDFGISDLLEILRLNSNEKTYNHHLIRAKRLFNTDEFAQRFKAIIFRSKF